ncbi:hypothetical protein [Caldibacillus debilis]|uniref:hypothetical protein n=1 Tax=Caldibacillus debilis TaxID=301148 RepID=UPI0023F4DDA3|nr:hypothetical protein [Caldibacillus debilis]
MQRFKTPVASNFGIGCRLDTGTNGNAIYKGFRLFRIARSGEEILKEYQEGFAMNAYPTAFFVKNLKFELGSKGAIGHKRAGGCLSHAGWL